MSDRLVLRDEVFASALAAMGAIRTDFESVGDACHDVSEVCGHPRLADALRDFATTWGISRRRLVDKLGRTEEELRTIRDQFEILDEQFGQACGPPVADLPRPDSSAGARPDRPSRAPEPPLPATEEGRNRAEAPPPAPHPPAEAPPPAQFPAAPRPQAPEEPLPLTPAAADLVDRLETVAEKLERHDELMAGAAGVGVLGLALLAAAGKAPGQLAPRLSTEGPEQVGLSSADRIAAADAWGRGQVPGAGGAPPGPGTTVDEAAAALRRDRDRLAGPPRHPDEDATAAVERPSRTGGGRPPLEGPPTRAHPAFPEAPSGPVLRDPPGTGPAAASRARTPDEEGQLSAVHRETPPSRGRDDPSPGSAGAAPGRDAPGGAMLGMASLGSLAAMRAGRGPDQSAADDEERLKTAKRLLERAGRDSSGEDRS